MKQAGKSGTNIHFRASWVYLLLLALLLYLVVPQLTTFKHSLPLLKHVSLGWLALAVVASLGAHTVAAFKYMSLAIKPLRFLPTWTVQLASLVVNRLLPAGIGGIGINYLYLTRNKHSKLEAGVVVSMNNVLGFVGHGLLVAGLLIVLPTKLNLNLSARLPFIAIIIVAAVIGLVIAAFFKKRLGYSFEQLRKSCGIYSKQPLKIVLAIAWSVAIAGLYAACLWYSAAALHITISFIQALIVLTLGVAASTVVPTPGGLIGVEAALVGGLVVYGIPAAPALAVALLYRLITYWFALLLGILAFIVARNQKYI